MDADAGEPWYDMDISETNELNRGIVRPQSFLAF
jgi:hypothetical protein